MPVTKEKQAIVAELKEKLARAKGVVLTNPRGLTVAQDTILRRRLRKAGIEYRVVKNTMTRIAAKELGLEGIEPYLEGPTALAFGFADPVAPAKALLDFARENKILEIKGGLVEGKVIGVDGVRALASLPPREVLIAQVLAGMQSPIVGLVNVLEGPIRKLAYVLDAIRKQKETA